MDRRDFIRFTGAASAGFVLPGAVSEAFAQGAYGLSTAWKTYEITTRVEVLKPVGVTRIWLPTPLTQDTAYHRSMGNTWQADGGTAAQYVDPKYGAGVVWAEFPEGSPAVLSLTSRFATRNIALDLSQRGTARPEDPAVLARFTAATDHMPTDGAAREMAMSITKGAGTDIEKASAIYEWIVENTYRDPKTRGCGTGDVKFMIENKAYGGKCADLNALYVTLARSAGLPARDVYGVRVAGSALGYGSLGKAGGDITKAQHCRAEVYLESHGWVPVDPADVRKVILEEAGGKKPDDPMVLAARKRLFGSWEMNWLAFNMAHDLQLPRSQKGKIAFLMYPQAETAESRLDSLDADNFKYTIGSKEIVA
jgi:transglutaminase-like putative cysteine protease